MGDATATFDPAYCEMTLNNFLDFPEGWKVLTCIQCGMCALCVHGEMPARHSSD